MKLARLLFIAIIAALPLCEGCKDEPEPVAEIDKLPAATQSGKQTFGCLIDGKAWALTGYYNLVGMYQEGILSIIAEERNKNTDRSIAIDLIEPDLQLQAYQLTQLPNARGVLADVLKGCSYRTTDDVNGTLTITRFYPSQLVISGTFEFEAYSDDCNETVKITEGRFDLKYAP